MCAWAHAAEVQVKCPVRYPSQDVRLSELPKGWDGGARVRESSVLQGAGFVNGPEEGEAEMIGSGEIRTKEGHEVRYPSVVGPKRLVCAYGGGVELWHRLPVSATICIIKTKKQRTRQDDPDIRIFCM